MGRSFRGPGLASALISIFFASACASASLEISKSPHGFPSSSCRFIDFPDLEKMPHDRETSIACMAGTIEKDREEVWIVPEGETESQAARGDVLVILPRASEEVQAKFLNSATGDKVTLRGVFSFDAECWSNAMDEPTEVRVCAPVSRPVRLVRGEISFDGPR